MKIARSQLKRIIQEELHAILDEQLAEIPQDIPTGGAPPSPVYTRSGHELSAERLSDLGFGTPEEYFEINPRNRPEPELDNTRDVDWAMAGQPRARYWGAGGG